MWLQCVCLHVYVHMYSMYLCTYACVCVLCVCSRGISLFFKYIIIHKSLYTIAVRIDLCGWIKGFLSALFIIIHRVLSLFGAAIAYTDHTYSDKDTHAHTHTRAHTHTHTPYNTLGISVFGQGYSSHHHTTHNDAHWGCGTMVREEQFKQRCKPFAINLQPPHFFFLTPLSHCSPPFTTHLDYKHCTFKNHLYFSAPPSGTNSACLVYRSSPLMKTPG